MSPERMSGPSEKAIRAHDGWFAGVPGPQSPLAAAHDPALGLDRSVCLRDVLAAIERWEVRLKAGTAGPLTDFLKREFGGES